MKVQVGGGPAGTKFRKDKSTQQRTVGEINFNCYEEFTVPKGRH